MADGNIAGLGTKQDFVAVSPGADPKKLNLSADEALIYARIGRAAQIGELIEGSSLGEPKTISVLLALRARGAIVPARVTRPPPQAPVNTASIEEVDLPEDKKREILAFEARMETASLFELLGVPNLASNDETRKGFHEMSRKYHPDRFFGKNLGSFRSRLERIFRKISEAHQTLSDPGKRAAYLKAHPELVDKEILEVESAPREKTAEDLAREAERRNRLARHPYLAKSAKVSELLEKAKSLTQKGDHLLAVAELQNVLRLDERHAEARALLGNVKRKADAQRAETEFNRALELIDQGEEDKAVSSIRAALGADPAHARANFQMARMLLDKGESKEATGFATKAVEHAPDEPKHRELLAKLYDLAGMKAMAKKQWEELLRLSPNHAEAKKQVKGRWPF